jgi:hypothetical protein
MKQKYKDVMIAMGIKISALEKIASALYVGNEASRGSFRSLFPRVDRLEKQMPYLKDYDIAKRITGIIENLAAHHERMNRHDTRIAGLETAHNCQVTANDDIFDKLREIGRDIKNLERRCYDIEKPKMQSHHCANLDSIGDQCRFDAGRCQYKLVTMTKGALGPVFCGKDQIVAIQKDRED